MRHFYKTTVNEMQLLVYRNADLEQGLGGGRHSSGVPGVSGLHSGSSADGRGAAAGKAVSGAGSRGGLAAQQPEGLRSISVDRGRMMIEEEEEDILI